MNPTPSVRAQMISTRVLRREQLEAAYRAGLIANFTMISGAAGKRLVWDVHTFRGAHLEYISADLIPFLTGLLYAPTSGIDPARLAYLEGLLNGTVEPDPDYTRPDLSGIVEDGQRIAFADLPRFFGVSQDAVWKYARGERSTSDLALILEGVDTTVRHPYEHAWTTKREARHWGQANGILTPDGTPARERSAVSRANLAKRWPAAGDEAELAGDGE